MNSNKVDAVSTVSACGKKNHHSNDTASVCCIFQEYSMLLLTSQNALVDGINTHTYAQKRTHTYAGGPLIPYG